MLDVADATLIEHAVKSAEGVTEAEKLLNDKLVTAVQAIAHSHGSLHAHVSNRGTKRKRNEDIATQDRTAFNGNMLPTGLQLLVTGEDEINAGLMGKKQLADGNDAQQKVDHVRSPWHSDEVHEHCNNDPDFGNWVHSRWDPVVQSLVACLPEDASIGDDYVQQRTTWQDEWTKKDSAAISVMMRKEPSILVNQMCSRIEILGRS